MYSTSLILCKIRIKVQFIGMKKEHDSCRSIQVDGVRASQKIQTKLQILHCSDHESVYTISIETQIYKCRPLTTRD